MTKPNPKGYNEEDNCSSCGSEQQSVSSPYEVDDETYQDMYCQNCGSVLEINKYQKKEDEQASDTT